MNEQQELINNINDLRKLFSQLRLDDSDFPYKPSPSSQSTGVYCFRGIQIVQKVSSSNNKSLLERVWTLFKKLEGKEKQLPQDVNEILVTIRASEQVFKQGIFVKVGSDASKGMVPQQTSQPILQSLIQSTKQIQPTVIENQPSLTIQQVFDDMLQCSGNVESSKSRKKNMIIAMLKGVGLSLKNDYAKFHDRNVINKIIQNVMNIENLKNGGKKTRLSYIRELVLHACAMEPDFFSQKVIAGMPTIKKDDSSDNGHLPYSDDQLLNIFNPNHNFFKNNPDCFWVCMISLFTGARANAAITLQYKDIINEEDIDCINFQRGPARQLKNKATVRKVPIHHQLLDLGFIDYVCRKKTKTNAKEDDFIFDDAVHRKSQNYNNKYISRNFTPFLEEIGIKKEKYDGFDFHSFRDTISLALQKTLIPSSLVHRIIGWENKEISGKFYSKFSLLDIKEGLDKMEYTFLKPHFAEWKKIMAKKP